MKHAFGQWGKARVPIPQQTSICFTSSHKLVKDGYHCKLLKCQTWFLKAHTAN